MDPTAQDAERIIASLVPLPPARAWPAFVVLSGLPGSGKSTVADALRRSVDIAVIQSDRVRKLLVPWPCYSDEESRHVFAAIHEACAQLLRAGVPVLLDATNLDERVRRPLRALAARSGARPALVAVVASEQEIRRRLRGRHHGGRPSYDLSDADERVYDLLRGRMEPIRGRHWTVNTDRDTAPAVAALARWVAAAAPRSRAPAEAAERKRTSAPATRDGDEDHGRGPARSVSESLEAS